MLDVVVGALVTDTPSPVTDVVDAVMELLSGGVPTEPEPKRTPAEDTVVDLMGALMQSVEDAKAARRRRQQTATGETTDGRS